MNAAPGVAVVAVGDPGSPQTWSGVTAGLVAGLLQLGVATPTIDVSLPGALETAMLGLAAAGTRNRFDAESSALTAGRRSALARRALAGVKVDGVIQIGTGFRLPVGTRYVTLEDMTLRQASELHPVFSRMSARGVQRWERRRRDIYGGARMCAAASHWTADSLVADYGLATDRVAVVGFGATHEVEPSERDWSVPRYLFVGVDWERKGGPDVIDAFARVRREHPEAVLDIVGAHPPVHEPGVRGHGILSRADAADRRVILDLFARATCFVMPSRIEPFGIAYVEAARAGIASIAGAVGGPADLIGDDGGVLVAPGDRDALTAGMLRLAQPEVARRMGEIAHARAAGYTWGKVAERLLRALGIGAPDGRELTGFL